MTESRRKLSDEMDVVEAELRGQDPGPFEAGEELGQPLRVRGMVIPVHLDRDGLRLIRNAAQVDDVSPSEFIRRSAIEAAEARVPSAHEAVPLTTGSNQGDGGDQ